MRSRKWLYLVLAVIMIAAPMLGAAQAAPEVTEVGTYPIPVEGSEPIKLSVWRSFNSTIIQSWEENRMYQEVENKTGVDIEWISPPTGQERDHYNLTVAANDLPDVFYGVDVTYYRGGIAKAIEDEVYIDLTPYGEYMPNYLRWLESDPQINKEARMDDGRIACLQQVQLAHEAPWCGAFIRVDLLEKAGLDMPETIADWYETLTAFKELGVEIPLGGWYGNLIRNETAGFFQSCFQAPPAYVNIDGTVNYGYIMPGFKDFLTEMAKWYAEGLLDPDFDTRPEDGAEGRAMFCAGTSAVIVEGYGDSGIWQMSGQAGNPEFLISAAPYPVMNKGDDPATTLHYRQENYMVRGQQSFVSTDCAIPEIAVRWLDFGYTVDGFLLNNYGVEGESWEWVDGEPEPEHAQYFPPELLGIGKHPWFTDLMMNNPDGYEFWTMVQKYKTHNGTHLRNPNSYLIQDIAQESMKIWTPPGSDWFMPQIARSTEEQIREGELIVDMEAYRDEMLYKFVKGQEPLDNFDSYVDGMKALGIEELIALRQAALDRYIAR